MATQDTAPEHAPEAGGATVDLDPMHQFEIYPLVPIDIGGINASFTNSSLWMVIAAGVVILLLLAAPVQARADPAAVGGRGLLRVHRQHDARYPGRIGPAVLSLRVHAVHVRAGANMLGMFPYSFTVTSHIIVTFALAIVGVHRRHISASGSTALASSSCSCRRACRWCCCRCSW
jgi:F-type H+-transporting ATPase subunit a